MPVKAIEKVVNGRQVQIVQFHAIKGIKIKAKLFKFLLPVISPFISALDINSVNDIATLNSSDLNLQAMIPTAFQKLAETLEPDQFLNLILDLLSEVFIDGSAIDEKKFNDLFIGDYMFAYQLAYEVVMANNFLALSGIGNLLKENKMPPQPEKSDQS